MDISIEKAILLSSSANEIYTQNSITIKLDIKLKHDTALEKSLLQLIGQHIDDGDGITFQIRKTSQTRFNLQTQVTMTIVYDKRLNT